VTERRGLNPHDKFFKDIWSRPDIAWDFLMQYLPPAVTARFVPGSLQLQKDSFIDAAMQEHFSDLLYRVQLHSGGAAFVYLLLEHKSSPDSGTPFQLLQYMVQIWDRERQRKAPLLPIIPLVLERGPLLPRPV
jgi:predicted transposase/invertase (TIGR01784 family)